MPRPTVSARRLLAFASLGVVIPLALFALARGQPTRSDTAHGIFEFDSHTQSSTLDDPNALGLNILFDWAELEPRDGVYDWTRVDRALERAERAGKRIVPRVYTNKGEFGQATPDWLFETGAQAYYVSEDARIPQPVPTDPIFIERFGRFIQAFGERYDGRPAIEFVQTNATMGVYGEMVWAYSREALPAGWSGDLQIATSEYWIDRWRAALPSTPLALMINYIGYDVVETLSWYAVERGYYLQSNDPNHRPETYESLVRFGDETKIILEIEDSGCRNATGTAFDAMIDRLFSLGYPVDYLVLCHLSFGEPEQVEAALERLRK